MKATNHTYICSQHRERKYCWWVGIRVYARRWGIQAEGGENKRQKAYSPRTKYIRRLHELYCNKQSFLKKIRAIENIYIYIYI